MKSPQEPSHNPDESLSDELDFEQALASVEQSFQALKSRYVQVQQDQQAQLQVQRRRSELKQQLRRSPTPELQAELKQIQNRLDELEINLESRLFSWESLKEPFWQIVRFGGLGVVIGWFLALAVIKSPPPEPQPSAPIPENPRP